MTPADAAAVERAQRVRATAGADATPEVAAAITACELAGGPGEDAALRGGR